MRPLWAVIAWEYTNAIHHSLQQDDDRCPCPSNMTSETRTVFDYAQSIGKIARIYVYVCMYVVVLCSGYNCDSAATRLRRDWDSTAFFRRTVIALKSPDGRIAVASHYCREVARAHSSRPLQATLSKPRVSIFTLTNEDTRKRPRSQYVCLYGAVGPILWVRLTIQPSRSSVHVASEHFFIK